MSLAWTETGSPTAPTIVFLHGAGAGAWMWRQQMAALGEFHCIAIDLPGHGASAAIEWESLEQTAALVAECIQAKAQTGKAHVVGLSLGAYVAMQLAAQQPHVIDRMVVSGLTVLPLPYPRLMAVMGYLMLPFLKTGPFIKANAKALRIPDALLEDYHVGIRQMSRRAFVRASNNAAAFRLPPTAGSITTPTLALAGSREHPTIHRSLAVIGKTLPNSEVRLAPNGGHGWNGELPALFNATIRGWFDSLQTPVELQSLTEN